MSGELALLIHPSTDVLDGVGRILHDAGYKVLTAPTPEDARRQKRDLRFASPDVVLAPLGQDGGGDLREVLGGEPDASPTPLVVLANGDGEERRRALRLGLSTILSPPWDREEVVLTTGLAVENGRREPGDRTDPEADTSAQPPSGGGAPLAGSLGQMSVADLLQTAETNRRSGRLDLHRAGSDPDRPGPRGTLWLRDGRVVAAEVDDGREGEEAVYALASWEEGRFEARFGEAPDVEEGISASTTSLLLEAMHRLDESRRQGRPPNAAIPDGPPRPPRELWTLHRALTLLNIAASYGRDHLTPGYMERRLEETRAALEEGHPVLARFAVGDDGQVTFPGGSEELATIDAGRLVDATAAWLRRLFTSLERAAGAPFRLERIAELSEAVRDDLAELGFYDALGFETASKEDH